MAKRKRNVKGRLGGGPSGRRAIELGNESGNFIIGAMKKLMLPLVVLFLSATTALSGDQRWYSNVIHSTDQPFSFVISGNQYMKISNFTHSGNGSQVGRILVFQGLQGLPGIEVMQSDSSATGHIEHEDVYIAGPTVIYIQPLSSETLFLTYLWGTQ